MVEAWCFLSFGGRFAGHLGETWWICERGSSGFELVMGLCKFEGFGSRKLRISSGIRVWARPGARRAW